MPGTLQGLQFIACHNLEMEFLLQSGGTQRSANQLETYPNKTSIYFEVCLHYCRHFVKFAKLVLA